MHNSKTVVAQSVFSVGTAFDIYSNTSYSANCRF